MFPFIFGFPIFSVLEQFNLQMLQVGFFFPVSLIVGSSASVVYGIRQVIFCVFLIHVNERKIYALKLMPLFQLKVTALKVKDQMND